MDYTPAEYQAFKDMVTHAMRAIPPCNVSVHWDDIAKAACINGVPSPYSPDEPVRYMCIKLGFFGITVFLNKGLHATSHNDSHPATAAFVAGLRKGEFNGFALWAEFDKEIADAAD